ncbi:hypothetical protein [Thermogemmatispora sp.]
MAISIFAIRSAAVFCPLLLMPLPTTLADLPLGLLRRRADKRLGAV